MNTFNSYSSRAPIQVENIPTDSSGGQEDKRPRTRCGYLVPDAYANYEQAIGQTGSQASGRAIHFAADLICSGGLDIWIRGVYSYALTHIGLANPRILVYLKQRIASIDRLAAQLPQESFFSNRDVQNLVSEVVLILQLCPKRAKVVWPKVDDTTKTPGWIRSVAGSPETAATRKVWSSDGDSPTLYLASNELCKAITEGSSERALFWIRWVLEEDSKIKKETKGNGLSSKARGPETLNTKSQTEAGHYIAALLLEIYRDLMSKGIIRMNEEFQELIRLWRGGETRMAARLRKDCLGWMTMICCEVPRWKVPAAPTLVEDPVRLSRAVGGSTQFFNEVLSYPPLPSSQQLKAKMMKAVREKKAKNMTEKEKKAMTMEEQFDAFDAVMEAYLNK
jgi:hypothetical protein